MYRTIPRQLLCLFVVTAFLLTLTAPAAVAGINDLQQRLSTQNMGTAEVAASCGTESNASCSGSNCSSAGFPSLGNIAASCGNSSGGGFFSNLFQGIANFFKKLVELFTGGIQNIFNGGNNGGTGIDNNFPPVSNTPPVDNTPPVPYPPTDNNTPVTTTTTNDTPTTTVDTNTTTTDTTDTTNTTDVGDISATPGKYGEVTFIDIPKFRNFSASQLKSTNLADIENHAHTRFGNQYRDSDPLTWGHETTHGINSYIRNDLNNTGKKANGLYVGNGKGLLIEEPKMRKSQVVPFVPVSCRGFRFSTYISGQRAWDDMPTYILDEWVAYANGASVGVEQVKAGNYTKGNCDGVSGCLEFTIYSFALAMSISKNDPNYFAQNNQFKAFMEWHAKRAMALFHEGIKMKEFQVGKQMTIFKNFTTGGDSTQLRNFIIKVWGQEFWDSVMLNKK